MSEARLTTNASTRLYGIFGSPVRHSLSPTLHNALFQKLGMNAVYMAFEVQRDSLGLALEAVRSLDMGGVNLTIPLKEEALNHVDEIPEDVDRCAGALNTIVNRGGQLHGYNTDGPGLLAALAEELQWRPAGKSVLILGAGGAARGAAFALAHAGAERIWIANRTEERAQGLAEHLEGFFPETEIDAVADASVLGAEKIDLLVNATSCGMRAEDPPPADPAAFRKLAAVYDLIYNCGETSLLRSAKKLGLPQANGLGMLAAQAALAFGLWTGRTEGVREQMLEVLRACKK